MVVVAMMEGGRRRRRRDIKGRAYMGRGLWRDISIRML
jgi:hypothetical protein